eukprot:1650005-Pleurochrysis_carterae.AAC.1
MPGGASKDDRGELRVLLGGKPEAEVGVRLERGKHFLELGHPVDDQVEVLEAEPVPRLGGVGDEPKCGERLLPAHGQLLVFAGHDARGVVLKLLRRVGTRRRDHQNRLHRVGVLGGNLLQRRRGRRERRDGERLEDEVDQRRLQPLGTQRLHEQDLLKRRDARWYVGREVNLAPLRGGPTLPRLRVAQRRAEVLHLRRVGLRRPRRDRHGRGGVVGAREQQLAGEHLPLALAKERRVEQVDQVHGVGEPVAFEERARDRAEDEALQ